MQSNSPEDDVEGAKHAPRDAERAQPVPRTEQADEQHEPDRATTSGPGGQLSDQTAEDVLDRAPPSEPSDAAPHETARDFAVDSGSASDAGDAIQVSLSMPSPLLDTLQATGEFAAADAVAADAQLSDDAIAPLDDVEPDIATDSLPVEIDPDPFGEPDDISSDLDEPTYNADDADPRSYADSRPPDSPDLAAAATTFDTSAAADLSTYAPAEDVNLRSAMYISGRDADPAVNVPFPAPEAFDESQTGTSAGTPAPAAELSPRASALLVPTADGGPPLARPTLFVTLPEEQTRKIVNDALAADALRSQKLVAEIAEEKVNEVLWLRDCETRAVWGK